jgi:hypothetical protein
MRSLRKRRKSGNVDSLDLKHQVMPWKRRQNTTSAKNLERIPRKSLTLIPMRRRKSTGSVVDEITP